jgi:hypothetical protein
VEIDLGEYTGFSYEDASNAEKARTVMAKCKIGMEAVGTSAKIATESFEELPAAIAAYREMVSRARRSHEKSPTLIGWILEPVDIFESQAGLRALLGKITGG